MESLAYISGDPNCKVARYWANIEADRFRNMEQARQIWTEITKGPAGEKAHFWVEYIYLEKMLGDTFQTVSENSFNGDTSLKCQ